MQQWRSCLYEGDVLHRRTRPSAHSLRYKVYTLCLDLDELPDLNDQLKGFRYNAFAPVSVHDKDHGPRDGTPLKDWVLGQIKDAGVRISQPKIMMLSYPRILGYGFNPLTEYYVYDDNGALRLVIHEVKNTFGQQHCYVIPVAGGCGSDEIKQGCAKSFYVSPFIEMDMHYHFTLKHPGAEPADEMAVAIKETDAEGPLLYASFAGRRRELTAQSLAGTFWRFPLLTGKVVGGIHLEAFKLWRKGVGLVKRPSPPEHPVSIIHPTPAE